MYAKLYIHLLVRWYFLESPIRDIPTLRVAWT